jgi:hypothetical protein
MVLKQVRKMLIVKTRHTRHWWQFFNASTWKFGAPRSVMCDVMMMTAFQTSTSTTERRERGL